MTDRERGDLEAIYEALVRKEHEAGKIEIFLAENQETFDWARGYQEGVGKALDLLGNFLGLGVKFDEEGNAVNGQGVSDGALRED